MSTWPELCRPNAARLIITINCNYQCQMCTFWKERHEDPSLETIKHWIRELADFGIKEIDIGGGEPLLRKDLPEIVKEVKANGMRCGMTTNGWLVSELPFPDIDFCEISLDGAKAETHDKIRGTKGAFDRALKALEIARKKCPTHLNFTLQSDNYLELLDFVELLKKLKVPGSIIPVSLKLAAQPKISDRLSDYNIPILEQDLRKAMASGALIDNQAFIETFLRKLKNGPEKQKCLSAHRCILIFVNSDVYPCGNLDVPAGKLSLDKKMKDVWKEYRGLRKEIASGNHKFCHQCVYPDITTRATLRSAAFPYLKQIFKK